jgi:hypothetical protein
MKILFSKQDYLTWIDEHEKFLKKNGYPLDKDLKESLLHLENKEFPYFLIVQAGYEIHDALSEVLWNKIGEPQLKNCGYSHSYYNFCPEIVEKSIVCQCENEKNLIYKDVPEHDHSGNWTCVWLTKTGYDCGFGAILFKTKELYDLGLNEIRNFDVNVFFQKRKEREEKMIETKTPLKVFKSRWGFHPVSKEDYCKLKKLSIVYLKSLRLAAAHNRLTRKLPHNRKRKFPENPNPVFFKNVKGYWFDNGIGERLFEFYKTSRKPQDMEDIVFSQEFTEETISSLFNLI